MAEMKRQQNLGLQIPWQVKDVIFSTDDLLYSELRLHIDFALRSLFPDEANDPCPVHDTVDRQWRNLSFFEHSCYLYCAVPRITTSEGKFRTVHISWVCPDSGFTLLFEALALIERDILVNRVAEMLKVNLQRVWAIFNHRIGKARAADNPRSLTKRETDETSTKKGHHYVTVYVDLDTSRVIHVTKCKNKAILKSIQQLLKLNALKRNR